jgi:hypothetical protein
MALHKAKKGAITPRKTDRMPLPSGRVKPIAALNSHRTDTVRLKRKPPVNRFLNKTSHLCPLFVSNSTSSTDSMKNLIDSIPGTALAPVLKMVCQFVDQNRGAYDDLLRQQKNNIQKYVVKEREKMEEMYNDWIDEVDKELNSFIRKETAEDHSRTPPPDCTANYAFGGLPHNSPPASESPPKIKLEPQDEDGDYDMSWAIQNASEASRIMGQNYSSPYTSSGYPDARLPQDRPVTLDERIRISTANLLKDMQQKSTKHKKTVTGHFSKFASAGSQEHMRIAAEQVGKLHSLVKTIVNYEVRTYFLLLLLCFLLTNNRKFKWPNKLQWIRPWIYQSEKSRDNQRPDNNRTWI